MQPLGAVYFAFAAIVAVLYWTCCRNRPGRLSVLLLANLFFVARLGLFYVPVIVVAAAVDFAVGQELQRLARPRRLLRGCLLAASLAVNLGLLLATRLIPLTLSPRYAWVLPLSLSFYSFQSLTYTIDAYRGEGKTTGSLLAHLAAASFFPSIVAGPINRMSDLLGKLERPFGLSRAQCGRAILLIGTGLIKKLLIADFLADNLVNRVFDTPNLYSGAEVLVGVYGYALQLYYDFSGYTDLAMGVAQWFGIELPDNFRRPYWSASLREFWKRWHITFSSWLKDYLYRSLPRPKGWSGVVYLNLILTMMLSGLWHGLSWTFLVWGTLHGVGLAAGRFIYRRRQPGQGTSQPSAFRHSLAMFLTFQYVCLAWLFFRAASLHEAWAVLTRIASGTLSLASITLPVVTMLGVAVLGHAIPEPWYQWLEDRVGTAPFYLQGAALAAIVLIIQFLTGRGAVPFVYGGF